VLSGTPCVRASDSVAATRPPSRSCTLRGNAEPHLKRILLHAGSLKLDLGGERQRARARHGQTSSWGSGCACSIIPRTPVLTLPSRERWQGALCLDSDRCAPSGGAPLLPGLKRVGCLALSCIPIGRNAYGEGFACHMDTLRSWPFPSHRQCRCVLRNAHVALCGYRSCRHVTPAVPAPQREHCPLLTRTYSPSAPWGRPSRPRMPHRSCRAGAYTRGGSRGPSRFGTPPPRHR